MAYQAQAVDATEPISDTSWEIVANMRDYGIISGCDVTLDATDMTYDVAAGEILHNGTFVAVAAQTDAGTLVADGSNPRFAWIGLDSSGVDVLVSGDASADPVVPEIGDRTTLSLMRIPAAETLASNCSDIEKRIPVARPIGYVAKASATTRNSTTTMADDPDLTFPVAADSLYAVEMTVTYNSGTTPDFKHLWSLPSGATLDGMLIHQALGGTNTIDAAYVAAAVSSQGTGGDISLWASFTIDTAGTAGSATFQWAQVNSDAGDTTVNAGSWVRYRKIG